MTAVLIKQFLRLSAMAPLPLLHAIGHSIGLSLYYLPNASRRTATNNIQRCFPQYSPQQQQQLLRASLIESGKTLMELGPMWYWPAAKLERLIKTVNGAEEFERAVSAGQGVIALTPHLGQWELLGYYALRHAPMTSLFKPPRDHQIDQLIQQQRARHGQGLAATDAGGVKALLRALKRGHINGILPDQDPGKAGVYAPFFNIPTNTMRLVNRLARRSQAQILIVYAERLPRAQGFHVHIQAIDRDTLATPNEEQAAAALNRAVEQCVLACPSQYQWAYKRFKRSPT